MTVTRELAQAWLYMVLRPLIEGLSTEAYFLGKQNPTWRFGPERCEYIRPLLEYVPFGQEPTYEQFCRQHREAQELTTQHDALLRELEENAKQAAEALRGSEGLPEIVRRIDDEFPDWRGAYPSEKGPGLLAENAVNWSQLTRPADHYSNADAWEKYRNEVLALSAGGGAKKRFEVLRRSVASLDEVANTLRVNLTTLRDALADEHSVPPVPAIVRRGVRERFR